MAENKTKATKQSVAKFLNGVADEQKRRDCKTLARMMKEISGAPAVMWGESLVGYGRYHYKYASGHEGDFFLTGFSPRAQNVTVYIMTGFDKQRKLLAKLGKHKTGKSCLHLKKLDDIDLDVLAEMIRQSVRRMKEAYPE